LQIRNIVQVALLGVCVAGTGLAQTSELQVVSFAGAEGGPGSSDGSGRDARFHSPSGLWGDSQHLYIADTYNHTIRRLSLATGEVDTIAGSAGLAGSDDGAGSQARFNRPSGLWGDGLYLYVSDTGNFTIRKMRLSTGAVTTIAGLAGEAASEDGFGATARFVGPTGLWGDDEDLYIADSMSRTSRSIRRLRLRSGLVTTVVQLNDTAAAPEFGAGLWGDGSNLWIADSSAHTVSRLSIQFQHRNRMSVVAGTSGKYGAADGRGAKASFNAPSAIWGDRSFVYVADTLNHTIRRVSKESGQVVTLAGAALRPGWFDQADETSRFNQPAGMWSDGRHLFISEKGNHAIRRIRLVSGAIMTTTTAGRPALDGHTDGPPADALFSGPFRSWVQGGVMYVTDLQSTVRTISLSDGSVTTLAGRPGAFGSDDGVGVTARFGRPAGIWADSNHVFVSDAYFDTIRRISLRTGEVTTLAGSATRESGAQDGVGPAALFHSPGGIWGDGANLYVADTLNFTIRKIVLQTGQVSTLAGSPQNRGTADGVGAAARFYAPTDVWGDGVNLYVADGSAVRSLNLTTRRVQTLAGSPSTPGYSDQVGRARFSFISGIWGDGANLFVADSGNNVIRKISLGTGAVSTVAGSSLTPGSDNGAGDSARFYSPTDVSGDRDALYIVDNMNFKIRKAHASTVGAVHDRARSNGAGAAANARPPASQPDTPTATAPRTAGGGSTFSRPVSTAASAWTGVAIAGHRTADGVLVSEAAIPAPALVRSARIHAEIQNAATTGIAIANPNAQAAFVDFYFTDSSGLRLYSGSATIPKEGQIAAFLNQSPFAPPESLRVNLGNARTFTMSSSLPVAVTAVRGVINERSELLMTAIPVVPLDSTQPSRAVFPYYAVGDGWTTRITLINPTDDLASGVIELWGSKSSSFSAGAAESFNYTIPARSAWTWSPSATGSDMRTGWARIAPSRGTAPGGMALVAYRSSGVTVTEAAVPAMQESSGFRVYAETAGEFGEVDSIQTALAISNSAQTSAHVELEFLTPDGEPTGKNLPITLAARGHAIVPIHEPFRGWVRISGSPVGLVGLRGRYNERSDLLLTAMPAVSETTAISASGVVFPQFASGNGNTTQFIFLGGPGAVN